MAYHILIAHNDSPSNLIFDYCLGSAAVVDLYWESIGRKLKLPLISSITEKADYEGFVIDENDLLLFKDELDSLAKHWKNDESKIATPEYFFDDIEKIKKAIDEAFGRGLKLVIG